MGRIGGWRLRRGKELLLWVYEGAILGNQGGMDAMLGYLKDAQVMCNQDWVGWD